MNEKERRDELSLIKAPADLEDASNLSRQVSVEKLEEKMTADNHDLSLPFNIPRGTGSKTPTLPKARVASDKSMSEEASKGSSKMRYEKISSH